MPYDAAAFARLQADVDHLAAKVRRIEAFEDPMNKAVVAEFRELQAKVGEMDIEGTHVTQVRLQHIEDDLREMKEDAKAVRTTVRSALITAALSIGVQLILFAILRSQS